MNQPAPLPVNTGDPVLRRVFQIMDEQGVTDEELEAEGIVAANTVRHWRARRTVPMLETVEVVLAYLGHKLKVVPVTKSYDDVSPERPASCPPLTPREFQLFDLMHDRLGRTVRFQFLADQMELPRKDVALWAHKLRNKFSGTQWAIDTDRSIGYRLTKDGG